MAAWNFREYKSGDWKAMHALDLACFDPPFRFSQRAMRRFAEASNAIVLLAEASQTVAGFCIGHLKGKTAYIVTLDVAPEQRRLGLGGRLLEEVEVCARASGADRIALHVHTGNAAAIGFYRARGYRELRIARDFYAPGVDAFVYEKTLGAD